MWPAFPASDYYGSSATPRRQQRTVRLPRAKLGGHRRDASHVHHQPVGRVGAQLYPGGIATPHRNTRRGLARPTNKRASKTIPSNNENRAPLQPIPASFGAAALSRGFKHWFVSYAFLPSYRTRPTGGEPLLDCQGLLPPSTSPQASDCPSASPAVTATGSGSFHPTRLKWRLVAQCWNARGAVSYGMSAAKVATVTVPGWSWPGRFTRGSAGRSYRGPRL